MPIDLEKALAASPPPSTTSWNEDDVILYHLGIGAGVDKATDPKELQYVYENDLKVLPSFAVIPVTDLLNAGMMGTPGVDINMMQVLHGEQEIEIHKPLPPSMDGSSTMRIADIYDKGKAALVIIEAETSDEKGEKIFTNRFSIFARGEGGFGGESGPKVVDQTPDRAPDFTFNASTTSHQAILYRLNGDKNPLHIDTRFAKMGGFDTPILHGLCSFGIVCKTIVDELLDGDVTPISGYKVRFAGVVFPGETIEVSAWQEDKQIFIHAQSKERGTPVITNAVITLR